MTGNGGRALWFNQAENVNGSELTTESCLDACALRGFGYAGTEWSQVQIQMSLDLRQGSPEGIGMLLRHQTSE